MCYLGQVNMSGGNSLHNRQVQVVLKEANLTSCDDQFGVNVSLFKMIILCDTFRQKNLVNSFLSE